MSEGNKYYGQVDYKTGMIYEYSSTEKEGFEKHVSSTGKESYRRYWKDGASGELDNVSIRDSNFGKQISIALSGGVYVNFGINDQKGNIDSFAESLIKLLPFLNRKDSLVIKPYNFTPDGEKYARVGVSIIANGEKVKGLTNSYTNKEGELVAGDVPGTVWKKNALGVNKPTAASLEAKNDFLVNTLATEAERLKWTPSGQGSTPPSAPAQSTQNQAAADLPF